MKNILEHCFWDYDFTEDDIIKIVKNKENTKEKAFLFNKILKNSNDVFLNNFDEIYPIIINNIKDEKDNKYKILTKTN